MSQCRDNRIKKIVYNLIWLQLLVGDLFVGHVDKKNKAYKSHVGDRNYAGQLSADPPPREGFLFYLFFKYF